MKNQLTWIDNIICAIIYGMVWLVIGAILLVCASPFIAMIYFIHKEESKCYYEYVDMQGNQGTSKDCRNSFGTLYCGDEDTVIKVQSITKKCGDKTEITVTRKEYCQ